MARVPSCNGAVDRFLIDVTRHSQPLAINTYLARIIPPGQAFITLYFSAPRRRNFSVGSFEMSQESNWPLHIWAAAISAGLMFGAASLGGWAWDRVERRRGPVAAVMASQAVAAPVEVVEGHHRAHALRLSSEVCPPGTGRCVAPWANGPQEATEF